MFAYLWYPTRLKSQIWGISENADGSGLKKRFQGAFRAASDCI
nr:MAG TPA: hypothetical protein [Caudoviricetes sp.]